MQTPVFIAIVLVTNSVLGFPESRMSKDSKEMAPPTTFPLYGLLPNFNDIFERLRQQFAYLANAVPASGGNTTTITKEINGHKVVVNETVYSNAPGFEFHVRVIDIKPDEAAPARHSINQELMQDYAEQKHSAPDTKTQHKRKIGSAEHLERESVEYAGPALSYVSARSQPSAYNSVESLEDVHGAEYNADNIETFDELGRDIETLAESFEGADNGVEPVDGINGVVDLSNDIYVNEVAASQNWKPDPDAEVFAPYARVPHPTHDLSRDTYINELAAARGRVRPHPDTELLPISRFYYRPAGST